MLLKEIDKPIKTVAIHTILTNIFEPDKGDFKTFYNYRGDSVIGATFLFNQLHWKREYDQYEITAVETQKISEYWHKKLSDSYIKQYLPPE